MTKIIITCLTICFLAVQVTAQLNVKVGYAGSYSNIDFVEDVFETYEATQLQAEETLTPISFRHGLELGLRYKFFENLALDFGVIAKNGSNRARGLLNSDGEEFNTKWKSSILNYFVGLESYIDRFGIGASIGYQNLKYVKEDSNARNDETVMSQRVLNSRFYLIFDLPTSGLGISIRPFVSTTLDPYNFNPVAEELSPGAIDISGTFNQDVFSYGLSILFMNGRQ